MSLSKHNPARWDNTSKRSWTDKHTFIKTSRKGVKHAFSELCRYDFSISHGGYNDVTRHIGTMKHTSSAKAVTGTSSVMKVFQPKQANLAINAELLFQGFVIEHNLPFAVNHHFSRLVSRMFPDSEIARQFSCGRTKAMHITYAIGSDTVDAVKQHVAKPKLLYSLATDGSSDEEDKFLPILISHEDPAGLITTWFIDSLWSTYGWCYKHNHSKKEVTGGQRLRPAVVFGLLLWQCGRDDRTAQTCAWPST